MSVRHRKTHGPGSASEATLFRQAQSGNRWALNQLMTRHDGLVHAILRRHGSGPLSYADMLQAGRIGLWRAILKFNPTRGFAFSTYAWTCIMRHVWQAAQVETHSASSAFQPVSSFPSPMAHPALLREQDPVPPTVQDMVCRLPARLQRTIIAHYGFDGDCPANFAQIGRALGVSEERARQLHQEALIWLRQPAHSQMLRSLLHRHTLADYQAIEKLGRCWWRSERGRHAD
jgi:RNA polymerase sigma factor (sigma-70 family)